VLTFSLRRPFSGPPIAFLILSLLLVAGACRSSQAPPPLTAVPTELSFPERARRDLEALASAKPPAPSGIDALPANVRDELQNQPWFGEESPAHLQLLTDFLFQASQNLAGVRPEWPYSSRIEGNRVVNQPFGEERELKIIDRRLFDFLERGDERIIVVFSSDDIDLQRGQIQPVMDRVRFFLPAIEDLIGHPYGFNYLHIQLKKAGDAVDPSYERGSNAFLDFPGSLGPNFDTVLVHELAHAYASMLPRDGHPWLLEGVAELVASILTGRTTGYAVAASYEPLPVDPALGRVPLFSRNYQAQSGNGSVFFADLLKAIGRDRVSAVLAAIHSDPFRREADIFDIIRAQTPPEQAEAVAAILDKWINGANLAKPPR